MQQKPERISSLNMDRGLYVLRYVSSSSHENPVIFVRSSPGDEASVAVIPFPGDAAGRLVAVGSLMVISALQACTLQVTAQATSPTGSLNAELQLDPLRPGTATPGSVAAIETSVPVREPEPLQAVRPSEPVPAPSYSSSATVEKPAVSSAGSEQFRTMAHIARRGDVVALEGVWLAGPDAPAPLEGFAVSCPPSIGDLRIQVLSAGEARWSDWLPNGSFGGSRGQARSLVGVRFQLVPSVGNSVSLRGEALFLGSAVMRKDGLELEFRSAAGSDPLLGLRLEVKREVAAREPIPMAVAEVPPAGRVRVFRASGRRTG